MQAAHDLVVDELAPETVARGDIRLLISLLSTTDGHPISGWQQRGKVMHNTGLVEQD